MPEIMKHTKVYERPIHEVIKPYEENGKLKFVTPSGRRVTIYKEAGFNPEITKALLETYERIHNEALRDGRLIIEPSNEEMREWSRHLEVPHNEGENKSLYYTAKGSTGRSKSRTESNPHLAPKTKEEHDELLNEHYNLEFLRTEKEIYKLEKEMDTLLEKMGRKHSDVLDEIRLRKIGGEELTPELQKIDALSLKIRELRKKQNDIEKKIKKPLFSISEIRSAPLDRIVETYNRIVDEGKTRGETPAPFSSEEIKEALSKLPDALKDVELVKVRARYGANPKASYLIEAIVPKEWAGKLGRFLKNNFFELLEGDEERAADGRVVFIPNVKGLKKKMIFSDPITQTGFVLGGESPEERVDYGGELKKRFMEMMQTLWMIEGKGVGLHAGTKELRGLENGKVVEKKGAAIFGLSGTGKSTISSHPHFDPEEIKAVTKQDDMVRIDRWLRAYADEKSYYFKTLGIDRDPHQRDILKAIMEGGSEVILENVDVNGEGKFDFSSDRLTPNTRAQVHRKELPSSDKENPDLDKIHVLIFNRRGSLFHPLEAIQDPLDAVAELAKGETMKTAGTEVGAKEEPTRVPAFNPFIPRGYHQQYFDTFYDILKNNLDVKTVLINTHKKGNKNIDIGTSVRCVEAAMMNTADYRHDPLTNTHHAIKVPGLNMEEFDTLKLFPDYHMYEEQRKEQLLDAVDYMRRTFPDIPILMQWADREEHRLTGKITPREEWEKKVRHMKKE
ncbi:MAG: phosphoenolpyruvate carboxykinase (ATP) [Candidatus Diapherotrites archaeon]|nr:phosphoenolpyruvate carboxykinase (ATP) [Candidatus Diapherotrites archaeon]